MLLYICGDESHLPWSQFYGALHPWRRSYPFWSHSAIHPKRKSHFCGHSLHQWQLRRCLRIEPWTKSGCSIHQFSTCLQLSASNIIVNHVQLSTGQILQDPSNKCTTDLFGYTFVTHYTAVRCVCYVQVVTMPSYITHARANITPHFTIFLMPLLPFLQ